jgi:CRISP-associated protein Cas1
MNALTSKEMKTILHSKRANLYYLEYCRVLVNGGRVEFVTEEGRRSLYWNIPIANTTALLLGTGTSITQAAMRELGKAGVLVGFCGGSGTPLFSATERDTDILWFSPQSEYRPTEYLQAWVGFWFDDAQRLEAAKIFQRARIRRISKHWTHTQSLAENRFPVDMHYIESLLGASHKRVTEAGDITHLLTEEARLTKELYKLVARAVGYGDFTRTKRGGSIDLANRFLDHGNYLAYGLGATATWVLGIPHGLAVLHGKTRRGGLVFDVADLIKDAVVLPQAFISAMRGDEEQEFRQSCVENLVRGDCLDFMIDTLKEVAMGMPRKVL